MKKQRPVKIRKFWGLLDPITRVIPDKRRRPDRKRKHKKRILSEG